MIDSYWRSLQILVMAESIGEKLDGLLLGRR
jgi:hypothetical protein